MISKNLETAINDQINAEIYSAYLYLAMRAYFEEKNLPGFSHWMYIQAMEELTHADRFYNYVFDSGGKVALKAIAQPPAQFKSILNVFEETLAHEKIVTAKIYKLVDMATAEKDHAALAMLQWFVSEQVEEEKNPFDIIQKLKIGGDQGAALLMMNQELAVRVFTPAPGSKAAAMAGVPAA